MWGGVVGRGGAPTTTTTTTIVVLLVIIAVAVAVVVVVVVGLVGDAMLLRWIRRASRCRRAGRLKLSLT